MTVIRLRACLAFLALCVGMASPATISPASAQRADQHHWSRGWNVSMMMLDAPTVVENRTLRIPVRLAAGGTAVRLTFSNEYGNHPIEIARTAIRIGGKQVPVTFGGEARILLPVGGVVLSDEIAVDVPDFARADVSIYLPRSTQLATLHRDAINLVAVSGPGDHVADDSFIAETSFPITPLLTAIDVRGAKRPVIVAFGDSITDAPCSVDATEQCRWGDVLGRRLADARMPHIVVTSAIGGNRVITPRSGPSALARLDRDALSVPGVTTIVLLEGINDIGNSGKSSTSGAPTEPVIALEDLIAGYRQIVARAHARGVRVIAMTILPFRGASYFSPERETMRLAVNQFIRTSGIFDGVIDMEPRLADPANPARLSDPLQRGDNLHPNAAGERHMGEAIDLSIFR